MVSPWILLVILLAEGSHVFGKNLPSFITKCSRSDKHLNDCIKAQVEKLRPRLLKGIPELHIPPYDPIQIPQLYVEQGTDAVKFKAQFSSVKVHGARNARIDKLGVDLKTPKLEASIYVPKMRLVSNYNITGKILLVPIVGIGHSDSNFTDVSANATITAKYEKKSGGQYLKLTDRKVKIHIGGAQIHFDNLFNGNRELSENTNRFINQNWRDIIAELMPIIEETIGSVIFQLVEHTFDSYPLEELLLP